MINKRSMLFQSDVPEYQVDISADEVSIQDVSSPVSLTTTCKGKRFVEFGKGDVREITHPFMCATLSGVAPHKLSLQLC